MENYTQTSSPTVEKQTGGWQKILGLWPDALAVIAFLLISFFYFQTPVSQGLILGGHDNDASVGLAHDQVEYYEQTGERGRWTNSLFGGMPTYQISPTYDSSGVLSTLESIYGLGTTGAFCYVFLYLLGFYILMRAFNFKVWLSALGAIVWAFSSYFFIIIAAGHIWKVMTLAFIPPTIGGMVLCYRKKYILGGAVTALFTALQIYSNHMQMTYYFLFVMAAIVIAYGIFAMRKKGEDDFVVGDHFNLRKWLKATGVILVAGILGVMANLPNFYHTYEYSKESMRGKSELTPVATPGQTGQKASPSNGLSYEYITGWSYGVGETLTLMIPDFKGGGSGESMLETSAAEDNPRFLYQIQGLAQALGNSVPGISCYWGEQPGTVGPVYVGAIICFLFVLGMFIVRGPMKWALLVSTLISFTFAWGSNIPAVTHFLIDYLPMYNKFRTVSSALVIAEFTMPLLAMLCLAQIIRRPLLLSERSNTIAFYIAFALTGGVCLLFWAAPSMAGSCINSSEYNVFAYLAQYQSQLSVNLAEYQHTISEIRHSILSASAGRSFFLILLTAALVVAYARFKAFKGWMLCGILIVASLLDMWNENKRYLNDDCFREELHRQSLVTKTAADEFILRDTDPDYRVYDVNGFTTNRSSYYHKTIGGYHAAKLRRFQDLIDRHISAEARLFTSTIGQAQKDFLKDTVRLATSGVKTAQDMMNIVALESTGDSVMSLPVLNMLNTRYFILGNGEAAVRNNGANGNAWFVQQLDFVKGADAEISALYGMDTKTAAVADEHFRTALEGTALGTGSAKLIAYQPNRLEYEVNTAKGGVLVFSEVYYPGWKATVDGQEVELGRVNYLLRGMKVAAGDHNVVLEFTPTSVTVTDNIAYIAIILIILGFLAALYMVVKKK